MSIAINKTTPLIPITSIGCKHVNKSRDIMHFNPCTQTNGMTIMDCRYTLLFSVRSVHFKDLARTSDNPAIYFTFHSTRLVYKHSEQNHYLHWTTMGRAFSNWKIAVSILSPPLRKRIRFVVYYLCIFIVKWVCFIIIIIVIIRRSNQYILRVSYGFKNEGDYYH